MSQNQTLSERFTQAFDKTLMAPKWKTLPKEKAELIEAVQNVVRLHHALTENMETFKKLQEEQNKALELIQGCVDTFVHLDAESSLLFLFNADYGRFQIVPTLQDLLDKEGKV